MTIANVALTDTFDVWRVRTNQLITLYDETNQLARSSYNATNLAVVTASNIAANIISGNSAVYNTIYASTNTIAYNVITLSLTNFYDAANASYDQSNTAILVSNLAYNQSNNARDFSNSAVLIANLAYDTANNFLDNVSISAAEVLASNTIIQNTINASVTQLFVDYLANNDLTYNGTISNSAFSTANSAYDRANTAGGGYFAGNNGYTGNANNRADIFRINSNTFTGNIVFAAGENASATGPLYMDPSAMIEIQTGARVVIL